MLVQVDSIAKRDANAQSFHLRNSSTVIDGDTLRYKEAAGYVETALSGKGLFKAPPTVDPDMIIDLDFGISPPRMGTITRKETTYRESPGRTRTESYANGTDAMGRATFTTFTVQDPPELIPTGTRDVQIETVIYDKHLRLTARESKPRTGAGPDPELWIVDVVSEGESRDLRKLLPILAAATIEYVGKDSQGHKTIKLKDKDADVAFVKRGM